MVEMHNGTSQMVMKRTALSMIHGEYDERGKREKAKVEPRSCRRTATNHRKKKEDQKGKEGEREGQREKKEEEKEKPTPKGSGSKHI